MRIGERLSWFRRNGRMLLVGFIFGKVSMFEKLMNRIGLRKI